MLKPCTIEVVAIVGTCFMLHASSIACTREHSSSLVSCIFDRRRAVIGSANDNLRSKEEEEEEEEDKNACSGYLQLST